MLIYIVMGFNVLAILGGLVATYNSGPVGKLGTVWLVYMAFAVVADTKNKVNERRVPLTELGICPYNFTALVAGGMFGIWALGFAWNAPTFWFVALYAVPMLLPCFTRIFTMAYELAIQRAQLPRSIPAAECHRQS